MLSKASLTTAQWRQATTLSEIFTAANAALLLVGNTTRRTNSLRSTRKANISLSVISSWTFSRYHAQSPTFARIPSWHYTFNFFTIRPEALNNQPSWFRLQDPSSLLDCLHQHQCTIERERSCWRFPQERSFLDNNCTSTYPFRRPVFHFVPCSLILPEQHVAISAWRARWTALFLISPSSAPLIYIASSIDKPRSI